jgi:hypothetical protein
MTRTEIADADLLPAAGHCTTKISHRKFHNRHYANKLSNYVRPMRSKNFAVDFFFETCMMVLMLEYKRNQIEEAISAVLEPKAQGPTADLRTRLKRLLETDRVLGRKRRSSNRELANYAFYSADPPGSGVEVWFSEYEAFALLNGLRLMAHGWPQGFAVSVLRRVRADLEMQHARILKLDPKSLFDQEAIWKGAQAGDMAFDNTAPVLLTIVSKVEPAPGVQGEPLGCAICEGPTEAMKWVQGTSGGRHGFTMFELVNAAHALTRKLAGTEPRHRGRSI